MRLKKQTCFGIMQILPSTAANEHVRIEDVATDPEQNIHASAKYMRHLLDTYLADPQIDPDVWFNNVEHAAAKLIGRETVQYVSNIYKYYLAYRQVAARSAS